MWEEHFCKRWGQSDLWFKRGEKTHTPPSLAFKELTDNWMGLDTGIMGPEEERQSRKKTGI